MEDINVDSIREWLELHAHRYYEKGTDEYNLMFSILSNHPNYEDWKFKEPLAFKITRLPKKKYVQVYAKFEGLKKDGGWRIVSWRNCVKKEVNKPTDLQKLNQSMRFEIRDQIRTFKTFHPIPKCELCECMNANKIEVDHDKNRGGLYSTLRDQYIEQNENDVPDTFWWDSSSHSFRFSSAAKWLGWIEGWKQFHAQHAHLRYLCEDCNKIER